MAPTDETPVIIVGGGVAGLACAIHLQRRGVPTRVLEAHDCVGGVLRTDLVDGFRLDRGFQVVLTAYPEVQAMLDLPALELRPFHPGALVRKGGRLRRVGDPTRRPLDAFETLRSGIVSPFDAWRVLRLRAAARSGDLEGLMRRPNHSTREHLERLGFSPTVIDGFLQPFFRGVFLEPALATSSRVFELIFRTFSSGPIALPAEGIGAVPAQLAARLSPGTIETGVRVRATTADGVTLEDGSTRAAAAVVVATEAHEAGRLLPALPVPPSHDVTTIAFDAPAPPVRGPWLILNADDPGPVSHLCVSSEVTPGAAPSGRALVSVTVLGTAAAGIADAVRAQLAGWFPGAEDWRVLRTLDYRQAIPRQTPEDMEPATRPVALPDGRFVCGGHRETSSLGGSLRSGRRAAAAVARQLGVAMPDADAVPA